VKVGNLVKRRNPPWHSKLGFGIVLELEAVQKTDVAKVKWVGSEDPPYMYKVEDLIVVSEKR
jgi:hypothetical protein